MNREPQRTGAETDKPGSAGSPADGNGADKPGSAADPERVKDSR